jgi:hypothetical protein
MNSGNRELFDTRSMMQRSFKSSVAATPIIFVDGQGGAEHSFNCDERGSYN